MGRGVEPTASSLVAVGVVSAVSLVGALALGLPGLRSHRFLLVLVAVAAGTLVGDAFFHLVPESVHLWEERGLSEMGLWVVFGFLFFFALEVVLRARHAHVEMVDNAEHMHEHGATGHGKVAPFAWTNLLGDAIHNFLDGAVIATSFLVDPAVGVATTIAVIIHEIPQELGDFAVLLRAGLPRRKALLFNFGSALLSVAGALIILALPIEAETIETYGIPLIVGAFLYIAASDLVPELHHHSRGREAAVILAAFVLGLTLMYGVLGLEESGVLGSPAEDHEH
jgi:zinc and cadmium transporter